jgi:hypothetical protein
MRAVTSHEVNPCNEAISIVADDLDLQNGHASHDYRLSIKHADYVTVLPPVVFQRGPIKEVGVNGVTHEVLLAILIDRLRGFQQGPYACDENHRALIALMDAREALFSRTTARVARGVEGTNEK